MKNMFDLLSEFIQITGNSTVDNFIVLIIGVVSFLVAFGFVGMIFDALGVYESDIMSDVHWSVRLIIFIMLSAACIGIAHFIKWLFSFQWWIYLIAGLVLIGIIILTYYLKHKYAKKKSLANEQIIQKEQVNEPLEEIKQEVKTIDRDHCPRCGAILVKRHGPFGDFYGCKNFSTKDCRYTRKFK